MNEIRKEAYDFVFISLKFSDLKVTFKCYILDIHLDYAPRVIVKQIILP